LTPVSLDLGTVFGLVPNAWPGRLLGQPGGFEGGFPTRKENRHSLLGSL